MRALAGLILAVVLGGCVSGCLSPQDQRPGLLLSGSVVSVPADWSFTDAHKEIAIQVRSPYLIPHSVTIWCVSVDGALHLAARDPETKNWPGWVDRDPRVRIRIDGQLYEGRLVDVEAAAQLEAIKAHYVAKYELPAMAPNVRYWRFES